MSRHALITLPFGDGLYDFRLGIREIQTVEEICDCGIWRIFNQLRPYHAEDNPFGGAWRGWHMRELIRVALIGGGKTQPEALGLVMRFVDERPIIETAGLALLIVDAALSGTPDETVGKDEGAGRTKAAGSRKKKQPSQTSTVAAP